MCVDEEESGLSKCVCVCVYVCVLLGEAVAVCVRGGEGVCEGDSRPPVCLPTWNETSGTF